MIDGESSTRLANIGFSVDEMESEICIIENFTEELKNNFHIFI